MGTTEGTSCEPCQESCARRGCFSRSGHGRHRTGNGDPELVIHAPIPRQARHHVCLHDLPDHHCRLFPGREHPAARAAGAGTDPAAHPRAGGQLLPAQGPRSGAERVGTLRRVADGDRHPLGLGTQPQRRVHQRRIRRPGLDFDPAVPCLHHPDADHRHRPGRLHGGPAVQGLGPGHHVLQLPRVHRARTDRLLPGTARCHQHQRDGRRTDLLCHRHLHAGSRRRRLGAIRRHAGPLRSADLRDHDRGLGRLPDRPAPIPPGQRQRRLRPDCAGQRADPQPGHQPARPARVLHPRGAEHRLHDPGHLRRRLLRREDLRLARCRLLEHRRDRPAGCQRRDGDPRLRLRDLRDRRDPR